MQKKSLILIIDDSAEDRKIMERYLAKAGYRDVIFAEKGDVGVEIALREKPDIIITDTVLPGIDGFEVTRRIKEKKDLKSSKVIIMTGSVDAVNAVKARRVGADDYCVKTSDFLPLIEALQKL